MCTFSINHSLRILEYIHGREELRVKYYSLQVIRHSLRILSQHLHQMCVHKHYLLRTHEYADWGSKAIYQLVLTVSSNNVYAAVISGPTFIHQNDISFGNTHFQHLYYCTNLTYYYLDSLNFQGFITPTTITDLSLIIVLISTGVSTLIYACV